MIGDWVNYRGICNRIAPADFCHFEWIDEIRPIPLTAEILEKNGLTKMEAFKGYNLMRLTSGFYSVEDHCLIEFKYVHQLQHLLRLIGLEKEIIL